MKVKIILAAVIIFNAVLISQSNRISYNNQQLFLSGANLAWVNFANDIGPGETDFNSFATVMLDMHDNGGNALRWWLHTNGTNSPQFDGSNFVIGPGNGTISDLKNLLDLAWEREIGMVLCLWSFDMQRNTIGTTALNRNNLLLSDTAYTNAYINNCLIPMVDSLKGHPAIIAWEIFNEPEGMSSEFGCSGIQHVPMSTIQRFINLCAGAIHRTDTSALVTNGSWSFQALTDVQSLGKKTSFILLPDDEKESIAENINYKYGVNLTTEEIINHLEKLSTLANFNYYRDDRLIAAGGDQDGTLDFYSVHYYVHLGTAYSPFLRSANVWNLNKPIVIAEFAMSQNNGVPKNLLFNTLYQSGYAGSLPWSWTDINLSSHADMLSGMKYMWDNYKSDVDVLGISGEWPTISIVSPDTNAVFPDSASVEIIAEANDNDGQITLVEFFINDGDKIGERDTLPYSIQWTNIIPNNYTVYAIATDDNGNQRTSNRVPIQVGTPPMVHLEAESASRQGTGMSIKSDPLASKGYFVDIAAQTGTITWTLPNVPQEGDYNILFGAKLFYDTPKEQFINVNGIRVDTVRFEGSTITWMERGTTVHLNQGSNTIQMELYWGWMYLDYLAVPSTITEIESSIELPSFYSLEQNYPNPFNLVTTINYKLPKESYVVLKVFDVLGREIITLEDEEKSAGAYSVIFNASQLTSGVYFYRLQAGKFAQVQKMIYLK
ncbi:MAG: T9SS type A sorting domain-containing protein [Ignavibacteriaceae bacterium]|nr:T9SS type A sorting domain-containing protein [Ignavibacteriaceae bacterium]